MGNAMHKLFLETARRQPEACALLTKDRCLTYGECAVAVQKLSSALADRLPPGSRVVIDARKSIDAVLLMLASLSAGMTYVPVDPTSPMMRRMFIVRDCQPGAIMVDELTAEEWVFEDERCASIEFVFGPPGLRCRTKTLLNLSQVIAQPGALREPACIPDELAYILYTSGSTGEPKGVMISRRNAASFVEWGCKYFDLTSRDRVAVHAPLHFDLPVFDIYVSLAKGATVCPIAENNLIFPEAVLRFLRENQITVLYAVPSALTALINRSTLKSGARLPALRLLLYAGEEFYPEPLARLMNALPSCRVYNLYGPIETNVVTAFEVLKEHLQYQHIPIGLPILNTRITLINPDETPVEELGKQGEIVVSGPSVCRGYLNRPDLTTKSKLLLNIDGEQLDCYRTGDLAVWDDRGVLHFLGRSDSLIKTRGCRVDLGDVESVLMAHPAVAEAAAIATPHLEYTNLIHAFAAPKPNMSLLERDLLNWCRESLPFYMVPSAITVREHLPKTSTGKIARRQLA